MSSRALLLLVFVGLGGPAQALDQAISQPLSEASRSALARSYLEQGRAYEYGEAAPRNPREAARLYCEAARLGEPEAQYSLGWMYANGRGIERRNGYAATLMAMAAAQGHEPARAAIARMVELQNDPASDDAPLPECMLRNAVVAAPKAARPATVAELMQADAADLDAYVEGLPPSKRRVAELIRLLSPEYGINPRLALAIAVSESNLDLLARSPRGALGVMQLIPETAARFHVRNTFDPAQNIRGGLAYVRWLLAYYRGDVLLAVAAYNAGEGAVDRFRGIPPFLETAFYVKKIYAFYKQPQHPFDASLVEASPVVLASTR